MFSNFKLLVDNTSKSLVHSGAHNEDLYNYRNILYKGCSSYRNCLLCCGFAQIS